MNKIGSYEIDLLNISPKKWDDFLRTQSDLPGQSANMELAKAFAHIGTLMDFKKYVQLGSVEAPENSPDEFLTLCGVLGIGEYLAKYDDVGLFVHLRARANDDRLRIREAVVLALQTIRNRKISRLQKYTSDWIKGTYLEQQVQIKVFCQPSFLKDEDRTLFALELLDWGMATIIENDKDHKSEGYMILQQTLSSCWGITVSALPAKGKAMMERWMKEDHPIVNDIMRENLKKDPLSTLESRWTERWMQVITG